MQSVNDVYCLPWRFCDGIIFSLVVLIYLFASLNPMHILQLLDAAPRHGTPSPQQLAPAVTLPVPSESAGVKW